MMRRSRRRRRTCRTPRGVGGDAGELELAEQLVVLGHLPLALVHLQLALLRHGLLLLLLVGRGDRGQRLSGRGVGSVMGTGGKGGGGVAN